jgi:hypothetical protein
VYGAVVLAAPQVLPTYMAEDGMIVINRPDP